MRLPLRFLLAALLLAPLAASAQEIPEWMERDPLPQGMTPEEELRRHEIGQGFERSAPPVGPVRNIAEFERNEAVLVRYPLGIPIQLVAALSEHVRVITLVASQAQQTQATSAYTANGVTMSNADFILAPTNSVWTRDYGPFYIADENNQVSVVDFIYNRPRPSDNAVPTALATHLGVARYAMDVVHTGGNYMTEGWGVGASTDLIWEENSFNQAFVLQRMQEYLGIDPYLVTIDPQNSYIKHIDTWAKFLDVDKVLIARVPPGHQHYAKHEQVAAYFASQPSAWGTPYQVFRVDTPNGQPYTNSLIVNERVYVPVVGSTWDATALAAYEAAMPGYEVLGIPGLPSNPWLGTDALHCRVKEVPDLEMLHIRHLPLAGTVPYAPTVALEADVVPYSGQPLLEDGLTFSWSVNGLPFQTLPLEAAGGDTYTATLPLAPGDVDVRYYFTAADASGRIETFPLVAGEGARAFTVEHETVEQTYAAGGQLVGLPLRRTHTDFRQVFASGAEGSLLAYEGGTYAPAETLVPGQGYWIDLAAGGSVSFAGAPVEHPEAALAEGWNLVAAPFAPLAVADLDDPDAVVIPHTVYAYDGGYAVAETLEPGRAYWIRAAAEGTIGLGGDGDPARPVASEVGDLPFETFHRLHLEAGGASSTLYLGADLGGYGGSALSFSLPPVPPAGLFDARFESHDWLTTAVEAFVDLQTAGGEVDVTAVSPEGWAFEYALHLWAGGEEVEQRVVASGETTTLTAGVDRFEVRRLSTSAEGGDAAPAALTLFPAYPNPFRASTEVRYALPEAGDVLLEVFNVVGQRVATLVQGPQPAGRHAVTLDAAGLASGTYLVRLSAGGAVETRRLTLAR